MAIYRCNLCGATTDTEATARALGGLYKMGTKITLTAPSKCGNCGSINISEVSSGYRAQTAQPLDKVDRMVASGKWKITEDKNGFKQLVRIKKPRTASQLWIETIVIAIFAIVCLSSGLLLVSSWFWRAILIVITCVSVLGVIVDLRALRYKRDHRNA